jgi:hypothetical protein
VLRFGDPFLRRLHQLGALLCGNDGRVTAGVRDAEAARRISLEESSTLL